MLSINSVRPENKKHISKINIASTYGYTISANSGPSPIDESDDGMYPVDLSEDGYTIDTSLIDDNIVY